MTNPWFDNEDTLLTGTTASGEDVDAKFNAVEAAFDAVEVEILEGVKFTASDFQTVPAITANAASRAGKMLGFDSAGDPILVTSGFAWRGDWTYPTAYSLNDIAQDGAGIVGQDNQYRCVVGHISSAVGDLAADISAGYWELYIDVAGAAASAAAASASAAAAAASESASASSAGAASDSADDAAASAASIPDVVATVATDQSNIGTNWSVRIGDILIQGGRAPTSAAGEVSINFDTAYDELPYHHSITPHHTSRACALARQSRSVNSVAYQVKFDDGTAADGINTDWMVIGKKAV